LQDCGAMLIPKQANSGASLGRAFQTKQYLDEVKIDCVYRYLDLEASIGTLEAALQRVESSLADAQGLGLISGEPLTLLERLLVVMFQDLERFREEVAESDHVRQAFFSQATEAEIREWLQHEFVDELEILHEQVGTLKIHTALAINVWQSLAQLDEGNG
jgi:hypothetical protein